MAATGTVRVRIEVDLSEWNERWRRISASMKRRRAQLAGRHTQVVTGTDGVSRLVVLDR